MCSAQLASVMKLDYESCDRYEVVLQAVGDGARAADGIERRSRETVLTIDVLDRPRPALVDPGTFLSNSSQMGLTTSHTMGTRARSVDAGG